MSGKKRTYGHPRFTPLHLRWLIQLLIAPNFFCSSLFLLQNKWYRHLQGIGGTITCASCLYSPKFVNEATVHNVSALAGGCELQVFHIWDEDMDETFLKDIVVYFIFVGLHFTL